MIDIPAGVPEEEEYAVSKGTGRKKTVGRAAQRKGSRGVLQAEPKAAGLDETSPLLAGTGAAPEPAAPGPVRIGREGNRVLSEFSPAPAAEPEKSPLERQKLTWDTDYEAITSQWDYDRRHMAHPTPGLPFDDRVLNPGDADWLSLNYPAFSDRIRRAREAGKPDAEIEKWLANHELDLLAYWAPSQADAYLGRTDAIKKYVRGLDESVQRRNWLEVGKLAGLSESDVDDRISIAGTLELPVSLVMNADGATLDMLKGKRKERAGMVEGVIDEVKKKFLGALSGVLNYGRMIAPAGGNATLPPSRIVDKEGYMAVGREGNRKIYAPLTEWEKATIDERLAILGEEIEALDRPLIRSGLQDLSLRMAGVAAELVPNVGLGLLGGPAAAAASMYIRTAGGLYGEARAYEGPNGERIDDSVAKGASIIGALVSTPIEYLQNWQGLNFLRLGNVSGEAARRLIWLPSWRRLLTEVGKGALLASAAEGGEEWLQGIAEGTSLIAARYISGHPIEFYDMLDELTETANRDFSEVFVGTLGLGLLGGGVRNFSSGVNAALGYPTRGNLRAAANLRGTDFAGIQDSLNQTFSRAAARKDGITQALLWHAAYNTNATPEQISAALDIALGNERPAVLEEDESAAAAETAGDVREDVDAAAEMTAARDVSRTPVTGARAELGEALAGEDIVSDVIDTNMRDAEDERANAPVTDAARAAWAAERARRNAEAEDVAAMAGIEGVTVREDETAETEETLAARDAERARRAAEAEDMAAMAGIDEDAYPLGQAARETETRPASTEVAADTSSPESAAADDSGAPVGAAVDDTRAAEGAAADAASLSGEDVLENAARRAEVLTEGLMSDTPQARAVRERAKEIERQLIDAGRTPEEARDGSRVVASFALRASEASGLPVRALDMLNMIVRGARAEESVSEGETLEQAMYKNPAKDIVEFRNNVISRKSGKSYFELTTPAGAEVEIAYVNVKYFHGANGQALSDAELTALTDNIENIQEYAYTEGTTGKYGGQLVLTKIDAPAGKFGVVFEYQPSGRVFIASAFKSTDKGIDAWIKKEGAHALAVSKTFKQGQVTFSASQPSVISSIQDEMGIVKSDEARRSGDQTFEQDGGSKTPKANIRISDSWRSVITLFEGGADASSFHHEFGHHMLNILVDLRGMEGVNAAFAADIDLTLSELGVSREDFLKDAKLRKAAHEKFARLYETYVATGKAPSQGLRATFERIRQLMINVYRDIRQALGVELSPEMQGVFDRLLATPREIAENSVIGDLAVEEAATEERLAEIEGEIREAEAEVRALEEAEKGNGDSQQRINDGFDSVNQSEIYNQSGETGVGLMSTGMSVDGQGDTDTQAKERARKVSILQNAAPVEVIPSSPLGKHDAITKAREMGEMQNNWDKKKTTLPVKVVGKITGHQGFDITTIFGDIKRLYENAIPAWSEPEASKEGHTSHPNIVAYHNYVNKFSDGTGEYYIRFTVTEERTRKGNPGSNFIHSTAISDIDVYKKTATLSNVSRIMDRGEARPSPFIDKKLQQFFDSVNQDETFNQFDEGDLDAYVSEGANSWLKKRGRKTNKKGRTPDALETADAATAISPGRPLSVESIQNEIGIVKSEEYYQTAAPADTNTAEFSAWFGESKVVDENGAPLKLYHQTDADIEEFDPKRPGAGQFDNETPFGVFLKPNDDDIGLGGKQMPLYARIENPFRVADRALLAAYLKANIKGYAELKRQYDEMDKVYSVKLGAADTELYIKLDEWDNEHPYSTPGERAEIMDALDAEGNEILAEWTQNGNSLSAQMKELVDRHFRESEYDGIVIDKDAGSGGRSVKTYIAFSPEQIKSVDNRGTWDAGNPNIYYQGGFDEGDLDAYVSEGAISFDDEVRIAEWLGMGDAQEGFTPEQTARMEEAIERYERTGEGPEGMEDVFARLAGARLGDYAAAAETLEAEGAPPRTREWDDAEAESAARAGEAGMYEKPSPSEYDAWEDAAFGDDYGDLDEMEADEREAAEDAGILEETAARLREELSAAEEAEALARAPEEYRRDAIKVIVGNGGISYESVKNAYGDESAALLYKAIKRPGMFTKKGLALDELAAVLRDAGINTPDGDAVYALLSERPEDTSREGGVKYAAKPLDGAARAAMETVDALGRWLAENGVTPDIADRVSGELRAAIGDVAGERDVAAEVAGKMTAREETLARRLVSVKARAAQILERVTKGLKEQAAARRAEARRRAATRLENLRQKARDMRDRQRERRKARIETAKAVHGINRIISLAGKVRETGKGISVSAAKEILKLAGGMDAHFRSQTTLDHRAEVARYVALHPEEWNDISRGARERHERELAERKAERERARAEGRKPERRKPKAPKVEVESAEDISLRDLRDMRFVGAKTLNGMTVGQLSELAAQFKGIEERGREEYAAFDAERAARREKTAAELYEALSATPAKTKAFVSDTKDLGKDYRGVRGALEYAGDVLSAGLLDRYRRLNQLDGNRDDYSGAFVDFFGREYDRRMSERDRYLWRRKDAMDAKLLALGFKLEDFGKALKGAELGGKKLTVDEVMHFYIGMKNPRNREAIL
jgi:hypothetical protein